MMNRVSIILWFTLVCFFAESARSVSPKVVCNMVSWSIYRKHPMSYLPENIPGKQCDVLIYSYLTINRKTSKLESRDREADYVKDGFKKLRDLKGKYPGMEVVVAVGGYDESQGISPVQLYSEMMATETTRHLFIRSARSLLKNKGFDGLELSWYYPGARDKENFVSLIKELNREFSLHNLKVYARVPFYNGDIDAGYNVTEISKFLTALHVNTINMIVYSGKNTTDNSSPLRPRRFDVPGSLQYYQNVVSVLNSYVSRGVPKEKLIFGVSASGHSFQLQDIKNNGLDSPIIGRNTRKGKFSNEAGILFYYEICAYIQSGKWISKRDPESGIPYAYNPRTLEWVSYDDQETIAAKARFAKSSGYGGIFLAMLDEDDFQGLCGEKYGLLRALVRELKNSDTDAEGSGSGDHEDSTSTSETPVIDNTRFLPRYDYSRTFPRLEDNLTRAIYGYGTNSRYPYTDRDQFYSGFSPNIRKYSVSGNISRRIRNVL